MKLKTLNLRQKTCIVLGIGFFATGLFMDITLAVALATVLILLSFVNERELETDGK